MDEYLRNRKRAACVSHGDINARGECWENTREACKTQGVALSHNKHTRQAFYFFYNISERYSIVNNFTQKIDVKILLTCTQ